MQGDFGKIVENGCLQFVYRVIVVQRRWRSILLVDYHLGVAANNSLVASAIDVTVYL